MLFTSYEFILFVAALLVLYYIIPKRFQWMLLLVASYIFYFCAGPTYLIYISVTTVTIYFAAVMIQNNSDRQKEYLKANRETLSKEEKKNYNKWFANPYVIKLLRISHYQKAHQIVL